ncbi:hypothetical protein, partial [Bifidobacterium bombi]|uniref:hypothetical protein n=1 Tax=Bifidobacterium bombi TaxID=471511 RepID=UPI0005C5C590
NGNNGGAAGVFPGVPGRLSVLAAPGAPAPATAPAPAGGSVSPRSGVRRRGRSHTRECVAWLDAGGDGVLSDYGPNGRVVPGQVRQVSDPCADQRSAVIGGAHGVRYVTWLPYFLSGALVGGFAMEAVYLALRRRMDDGDADDGYGRADGDDGRSRAAGSGSGRHVGGRVPLAGDAALAGVAGMARHRGVLES